MQIRNANVLVCGAGGFIGGHLVNSLFAQGASSVRAVDVKPFDEWYQKNPAADNRRLDLQLREDCMEAAQG
ncbi:MAG: NAD-dependent epimerase/dehydratase family protein, partial [Terracidiphilus sp.]